MHDWLAHRVRSTPDREALVNASSGNAWTYATLDETVEEMAGRLSALGVDEGDHVAAALETGVEAVCLIHASMRLGAVLVPLAPEFTPPELAARLDRADVDTVVCDGVTESQVRAATAEIGRSVRTFTIDEADGDDVTPLSAAEPDGFTPAAWDRDATQLLLFTSGTTGEPKAVRLTMGNLLASATASAFRLGIDPEDRWLVPLSLHHMGGIAPVLRSTLYGTTVIVRESFDPGGTVDDLREYEATCVSLVPTMLRRMLSARGTLPDCLRFALVGGAPTPAELVERCRDYSVPICPTYGMTETASQIATARHTEAYEHPETVGSPLLWTEVTVVDDEGAPVEAGESGELVVRGPTVSPGYYGDSAATDEAFGSHGLHTGDVGYRDESGRLYVLNRLDDRILTGGENVDPGEVVDAIRAHDAVADAAVVGIDDEEWGEQVAALLVPAGDDVDVAALEAHLRERLAGFKLPRTIGTVAELPRTVSGTVERDAVRDRLREGDTVAIERDRPSARAAGNGENAPAADGEEPATEGEAFPDGAEAEDPAEAALEAAMETEPTPADTDPGVDAGSESVGEPEPSGSDDDRRGGAALSSSGDRTERGGSDRLTGIGAPESSDGSAAEPDDSDAEAGDSDPETEDSDPGAGNSDTEPDDADEDDDAGGDR